jgi:hypothetical protein
LGEAKTLAGINERITGIEQEITRIGKNLLRIAGNPSGVDLCPKWDLRDPK